jgi:hypothetical protein
VSPDKKTSPRWKVCFIEYLPLWHFKEIWSVIARMMENLTANINGDAWWRFSTFVSAFNHTHSETVMLHGSSTFVLVDE